MLRRLREQVSQVANELPGVLSPGVNGSRDPNPQHADLVDENGEIEGFLCPLCMTNFSSPEQLSSHFEKDHTQTGDHFVNPNFTGDTDSSYFSETNCTEELEHQLRDEKQYSQKLKEELDRIQSVVAQATDVPQGEVPYLLQQIQVLEAGKSMVTQRMLEIEKESSQLRRAVDNGTEERSELVKNLNKQCLQIREMIKDIETAKIEKDALSTQLAEKDVAVRRLREEVDDLGKALAQRPSEDDVAVLRKELVHAQTVMDEITQQKEIEIQELRQTVRQLNHEREKDNCIKQTLMKDLESSGNSLCTNDSVLTDIKKELEDTKSLLEVAKKETSAAKNETNESEKRVVDLQTRFDSNIQELTVCHEKIAQLEETVRKSAIEIEDSHALNAKNQEKLLQLSSKLEQMIDEKDKQEMNLIASEEKHQGQADNIKSLEIANAELTKETSSLGLLLEQERIVVTEKINLNEELSRKIADLQSQLDASNKKCERQLKDLEDSAKTMDSLRDNIKSLEVNAQDLVTKISDGEGGAKMAIDQLTNDNKKLAERINELSVLLQEQKNLRECEIEKLNSAMRAAENQASVHLQSVKSEYDELKRKLQEAEDEIRRNGDRFVEMERDADAEREKTTERFEKFKALIAQKDQAAETLKEQANSLSSDCDEKDRLIRDKERHLEESRRKIEESVKRLEEAETKARSLEADLQNAESLREAATTAENYLDEQLQQARKIIKNLEDEGSQLQSTIGNKEAELHSFHEESDKKSKHWESRKEEYETQLLKNQEDNEELISSNKQLQTKFDDTFRQLKTKETESIEMKSTIEEMCSKITELESELLSAQTVARSAAETVSTTQSEISELEKERSSLSDLISKFEIQVKNLSEELAEKNITIEAMSTAASNMQSDMEAQNSSLTDSLNKLESSLKEHEKKYATLLEEKKQVQTLVTEKEVEVDILNGRITRLEEIIDELKRNNTDSLNTLNAEFEVLKSAHDVATTQYAESEVSLRKLNDHNATLMQEVSEAKESVKTVSARCSQFEKLSEDLKLSNDREISNKQEEIHTLVAKIEEQEHSFVTRENTLKEELSKLTRTIQSLQSELDNKSKEALEAKSAAEELAAKSMEQMQKIASWEDEKNALIERCLKTESDLDFERERALENKRRFDESVAAMHELGRANQSLQMDISKHSSRKWLDDSAAGNCTACGKNFTLTIRKHHCRVCGLIFCAPCSDKTVKIVSNKNPVRVCSSCFSEVSNR